MFYIVGLIGIGDSNNDIGDIVTIENIVVISITVAYCKSPSEICHISAIILLSSQGSKLEL